MTYAYSCDWCGKYPAKYADTMNYACEKHKDGLQ